VILRDTICGPISGPNRATSSRVWCCHWRLRLRRCACTRMTLCFEQAVTSMILLKPRRRSRTSEAFSMPCNTIPRDWLGGGACPSSVRGFEEPSVVWLETWRCLVRTAASCQIVSQHDEGCGASVWRLERSSSLGGSRLAHGGFIFHSCHFSFWEHEAHAGTWKTTDWKETRWHASPQTLVSRRGSYWYRYI
jgi:hypothetical protein